jgi:hypothetical protein
MAEPKIRVGVTLDPSGVQRGTDKANADIQKFKNQSEGAFRGLATEAIGATGQFGRLSQALLSFGPGGAAISAAVGGAGVVITILNKLRDAQIAATERQNKLNQAFRDVNVAQITASQGGAIGALAAAAGRGTAIQEEVNLINQRLIPAYNQIRNITNQLAENQRKLDAGQISPAFFEAEKRKLEQRREEVKLQKDFSEDFVRLTALEAERLGLSTTTQLALISVLRGQKEELDAIERTTRNLTAAEKQRRDAIEAQLRGFGQSGATPEVRMAALGGVSDRTAGETPAEKATREERERQQAIRNTKTEYDQLFSLNIRGVQLSSTHQERLTQLTADYTATLNNVNASLDERMVAAQALDAIERKAESDRKEKAQAELDEQRKLKDVYDKAIEAHQQQLSNIQMLSTAAVDGLGLMFSVIGEGGNALQNLGRGFTAIASGLARSKAAENIAYAIENFAKAIGFTATGQFESAAAAKTAAAGHLKAAAKWGAVAGASAAVGGGGSAAGGFGGRGFSQSALGGDDFGGTRTIFLTISGGGILDMNDPKTQRDFIRALDAVNNNRTVLRFTP